MKLERSVTKIRLRVLSVGCTQMAASCGRLVSAGLVPTVETTMPMVGPMSSLGCCAAGSLQPAGSSPSTSPTKSPGLMRPRR